MSYVEVEKLNLIIGNNTILKDISFSVDKGSILGLIGFNGSGKTMIMRCVSGLVLATEGTIKVGGKIIGRDLDFPESMGLIIETPGFIPYYSGFQNLKILSGIQKKADNNRIREVMKIVGLDPEMKKKVQKYSLGMRQRLGVAQAILDDPELLILDEPFNGLDINGVRQIRDLIIEFKKEGKAVILSSHNSDDINILCDKKIYLDHGHEVSEEELKV
ncbi:MAG: ABC transporter ATP-binding protein [Lachnospiraceae bacterium]|jgi:ABC-2 type transport system ATP-binding protein|nr:ABC transporter ATP-binding protein [Lachnospiraceae bacterium]MEE3460267.1 ABC transporter ATP-binding protein [Lachnospiraceae bacterium]